MTKAIRKLYTSRGLKAPNGKGVHTRAFHSCVAQCKVSKRKTGKPRSCYAACMASLGRTKAVKKAHRR